jgi:hypothetical protein
MTDKPEPAPATPEPGRVPPEPGQPRADHETVPLAQQPPPAAVPGASSEPEAPTAAPGAPTVPPAVAMPAGPPPAGAAPYGLPPGTWAPPPGWVPVGYAPAPAGAVPSTKAERRSWRPWPGWRRSLVPGVVGLILGGLLGSGITALATHDDGNRRVPVSRFGPGHDGFGPGFGNPNGNGFGPGNRGGGFGNRGQNGTAPGDQTVPTPQPSTS